MRKITILNDESVEREDDERWNMLSQPQYERTGQPIV